jgi:hypothetical protein
MLGQTGGWRLFGKETPADASDNARRELMAAMDKAVAVSQQLALSISKATAVLSNASAPLTPDLSTTDSSLERELDAAAVKGGARRKRAVSAAKPKAKPKRASR